MTEESAVLAGISSASIRGRVALGRRAGARVFAVDVKEPPEPGPDGAAGPAGRARAESRGTTIAGGTIQIQMTIIAERALGLPRSY